MKTQESYKVVKIMKKTANRRTLEKNLTREQAQRVVQSFPNSNTHIIVFTKQ